MIEAVGWRLAVEPAVRRRLQRLVADEGRVLALRHRIAADAESGQHDGVRRRLVVGDAFTGRAAHHKGSGGDQDCLRFEGQPLHLWLWLRPGLSSGLDLSLQLIQTPFILAVLRLSLLDPYPHLGQLDAAGQILHPAQLQHELLVGVQASLDLLKFVFERLAFGGGHE